MKKKGDISKKLCDELTTLAIELKSGSCAEDSRRLLKMLKRGANAKKWSNFERGKRETTVIRLISEILRRKPAAAPTAAPTAVQPSDEAANAPSGDEHDGGSKPSMPLLSADEPLPLHDFTADQPIEASPSMIGPIIVSHTADESPIPAASSSQPSADRLFIDVQVAATSCADEHADDDAVAVAIPSDVLPAKSFGKCCLDIDGQLRVYNAKRAAKRAAKRLVKQPTKRRNRDASDEKREKMLQIVAQISAKYKKLRAKSINQSVNRPASDDPHKPWERKNGFTRLRAPPRRNVAPSTPPAPLADVSNLLSIRSLSR